MQLRKKCKKSPPEFKVGQRKNVLLQYYVNGKKKEIPPNIKKKLVNFCRPFDTYYQFTFVRAKINSTYNSVNCILSLCFARRYIIKGDKICLPYCIRLH